MGLRDIHTYLKIYIHTLYHPTDFEILIISPNLVLASFAVVARTSGGLGVRPMPSPYYLSRCRIMRQRRGVL